MIHVDEVNSLLDTYIENNNSRLRNLEDTFEGLSLQMQDVQATLKLIMDKLGVQHNSPPVRPPSPPLN